MLKVSKTLSSGSAQLLVNKAIEKAKELSINISVGVVDNAGNLLAFYRMDNAKIFSIELSLKKAFTSAITQINTHEWEQWAKQRSLYGIESDSRLVLFAGGIKIDIDNHIVGGIGISGGTPEQDRQCCEYAVECLIKSV